MRLIIKNPKPEDFTLTSPAKRVSSEKCFWIMEKTSSARQNGEPATWENVRAVTMTLLFRQSARFLLYCPAMYDTLKIEESHTAGKPAERTGHSYENKRIQNYDCCVLSHFRVCSNE